jgi:hypothetical protein
VCPGYNAKPAMHHRITSLDVCKENLAECILLDRGFNWAVMNFSVVLSLNASVSLQGGVQ